MTELEKAQKQFDLIVHAICEVKQAAEEERKITHAKHINSDYLDALDCLELRLTSARAYAYRVLTIGR